MALFIRLCKWIGAMGFEVEMKGGWGGSHSFGCLMILETRDKLAK